MSVSGQRLSGVLGDFARTMVTDLPIQRILDRLVESVVDLLPVSSAGVTLIGANGAARFVSASDDSALLFEKLQSDLDEGPCVRAHTTGSVVVVTDLRQDVDFPGFTPPALDAGLRAVVTLPLRHGTRPLGAMSLYRNTRGGLSHRAMETACTLADVAAAYLFNAQRREELEILSDQTRHAALHDPLTGLPNRLLLIDRLTQAFQRSRRTGKASALLYIDLDEFKAVNDSYGHSVGDALLVAVSDRLTELVRPHDTLVRLAGDEFVVLCEDLDDPGQATHIAARLKDALNRPLRAGDIDICVGASIGLAYADPGDDHDADRLLHEADMAMYAVKRSARGHRESVRYSGGQLSDLQRDLPAALARSEFRVEYQPIVSVPDGRVSAVEALLRWSHPVRGTILPGALIPLAEHSGLVVEIGGWLLRQAWADADRWRRELHLPLTVAVKVSPHQLLSAGFVDTVSAVLGASPTQARFLVVEITDSAFARDSDRAMRVLADLVGLGVQIALDEFGAGHSSFVHLKKYPVDILKIDPAFAADLGRDEVTDTIVGSMISLGHDLDLQVVAQGIDSAAQQALVGRLGCDACQGPLFGRPMEAAEMARLLRPQEEAGASVLPMPRQVPTSERRLASP